MFNRIILVLTNSHPDNVNDDVFLLHVSAEVQ